MHNRDEVKKDLSSWESKKIKYRSLVIYYAYVCIISIINFDKKISTLTCLSIYLTHFTSKLFLFTLKKLNFVYNI